MFKYNQADKGAPKVGFGSGGDGFPPGEFVVVFRKAKEQASKNLKTGTAGQPMVVTEWEILDVARKDYEGEGYKGWDGNVLTAKPGVKRSYVLKMWNVGAIGDLNELASMLSGINTKNPAAMRAAGLVAKDDSAVEVDRLANAFNGLIERMLSEDGSNPLGGFILRLEVSAKTNETTKKTFMVHKFSYVNEAADDNAALLAKIGLKIAA